MTLLTALNFFTIACGVVALWAAIGIYRLTRAKSTFVIMAALAYTLTTRTAISISEAHPTGSDVRWIAEHASYLIVGFWPLIATGMVLLLRSLRRIYEGDRRQREDPDYQGPERRRQRTGGSDAGSS